MTPIYKTCSPTSKKNFARERKSHHHIITLISWRDILWKHRMKMRALNGQALSNLQKSTLALLPPPLSTKSTMPLKEGRLVCLGFRRMKLIIINNNLQSLNLWVLSMSSSFLYKIILRVKNTCIPWSHKIIIRFYRLEPSFT